MCAFITYALLAMLGVWGAASGVKSYREAVSSTRASAWRISMRWGVTIGLLFALLSVLLSACEVLGQVSAWDLPEVIAAMEPGLPVGVAWLASGPILGWAHCRAASHARGD